MCFKIYLGAIKTTLKGLSTEGSEMEFICNYL